MKLLLGLLHFQPAHSLLFGEPLLLLAADLRKALRPAKASAGTGLVLFILLLLTPLFLALAPAAASASFA